MLIEFAKAAPPHHIFAQLPYPEEANTPLWTIKYEILAYVVLAAFSAAGWTRRPVALWGALGLALALFMSQAATEQVGATSHLYQLGRYGVCFGLGMVVYHHRDRVSLSPWWFGLSVLVLLAVHGTPLEHAAYILVAAHGAMLVGARNYGALTRLTQRHDISYGVYIYAWPVQQFVTLVAGPELFIPLDLLIVMAITVPLAFLSCILIERPALARKAPAPAESPQEAPFP